MRKGKEANKREEMSNLQYNCSVDRTIGGYVDPTCMFYSIFCLPPPLFLPLFCPQTDAARPDELLGEPLASGRILHPKAEMIRSLPVTGSAPTTVNWANMTDFKCFEPQAKYRHCRKRKRETTLSFVILPFSHRQHFPPLISLFIFIYGV